MIPTEREIRAMAFEICLHRGEHPNQTDNGGVEEWEKYKPLAVAVLDQAERLLSLRAAPAGNELVERESSTARADAQAQIPGGAVAKMVMEFWHTFKGVYPEDVMSSSLCAIGPLQSMIGLAIQNGSLCLPVPPATIRLQALEEAAKVADAEAQKWRRMRNETLNAFSVEALSGAAQSADLVAAAIRALAQEKV